MTWGQMKQTDLLCAGEPYWIYDHGIAERYDLKRNILRELAKKLTLIQIRIKNLPGPAIIREAALLRDVIRESNSQCKIIMNDSAEICKELGLDGVHLGQSDGSAPDARKLLGADAVIGLTVRSLEEAEEAQMLVKCKLIDYIGVGTVYETTTKPGLEVKGLEFIQEILKLFPAETVYPIGGINESNIQALFDLGVKHCAISSSLYKADVDLGPLTS
jgi:thiamine-phosphate pyrophosphorylase